MNILDYKFKIGDEVISTEGEKGVITYICECNKCKSRGFCEPLWIPEGYDHEFYISNYEAEHGFRDYYRIGQYRFNEFDDTRLRKEIQEHEDEIARLKKQLQVIEEIRGSEGKEK